MNLTKKKDKDVYICIRLDGVPEPVKFFFNDIAEANIVFGKIASAINNNKPSVKFTDYNGYNILLATNRIIGMELEDTVGV